MHIHDIILGSIDIKFAFTTGSRRLICPEWPLHLVCEQPQVEQRVVEQIAPSLGSLTVPTSGQARFVPALVTSTAEMSRISSDESNPNCTETIRPFAIGILTCACL